MIHKTLKPSAVTLKLEAKKLGSKPTKTPRTNTHSIQIHPYMRPSKRIVPTHPQQPRFTKQRRRERILPNHLTPLQRIRMRRTKRTLQKSHRNTRYRRRKIPRTLPTKLHKMRRIQKPSNKEKLICSINAFCRKT